MGVAANVGRENSTPLAYIEGDSTMATIKYTNQAPEYFWDVFSQDYDFTVSVSADKKTVTLTFSGAPANGTNTLVFTGTGLSVVDGKIATGTVTGVSALNAAGREIYAISDLAIKGYFIDLNDLWNTRGRLLSGNDTIAGSDKSDDISSGDGNDTVKAGKGDDFISDHAGSDTYDGGAGYDSVSFTEGHYDSWHATKGVVVDLKAGTAKDPWGFSNKLISIENLRGTMYADKFYGSNRTIDEFFQGLAGSDFFDGRGGASDTIDYGRDAEYGGHGKVSINLRTGKATDGFGDIDTLKNIENAGGGQYNDSIVGNAKANFLRGHDGNDVIRGGGGGDSMEGEQGNDTLFGTSGSSDVFVFRDRGDSLGTDRLKNFTDGEDVIQFRDIGGVSAISDLTLEQSGNNVVITYDLGKVIVENITVAKLTAGDFLFE